MIIKRTTGTAEVNGESTKMYCFEAHYDDGSVLLVEVTKSDAREFWMHAFRGRGRKQVPVGWRKHRGDLASARKVATNAVLKNSLAGFSGFSGHN